MGEAVQLCDGWRLKAHVDHADESAFLSRG